MILASTASVACYGTLSQRSQMSRDIIQRFLKSLPPSCLCVFNVNFRQQFYDFTLIQKSLKFANVLKLSDEELPVLASVFKLSGSNMTIIKILIKQYDLHLIALTQGKQDAILISNNQVSECQGVQVEVGLQH